MCKYNSVLATIQESACKKAKRKPEMHIKMQENVCQTATKLMPKCNETHAKTQHVNQPLPEK